jgi:hypothetical protein
VEGQGALKTVREKCKKSEDQRMKEIKRLWIIKMDNSKYLTKLMDSMPRRVQEIIARQGASKSTEIIVHRKICKINCFFQFSAFFCIFVYDRPVSRPLAVCTPYV